MTKLSRSAHGGKNPCISISGNAPSTHGSWGMGVQVSKRPIVTETIFPATNSIKGNKLYAGRAKLLYCIKTVARKLVRKCRMVDAHVY